MTIQSFNITATFWMGDSGTSLCEMSEPLDAEEFFDRLKVGFLHWRRNRSESMQSLSITAPIPRREDFYRELIEGLCSRWNSDEEIANVGPSHVELSLAYHYINWVGCTTAKNAVYKSNSEQGAMQFVDYVRLLEDINARLRKAKADEKSRRRANPVKYPVELPGNIKTEIARYLRLEYGESARDKDSLKARDLKFVGEFVIDGVPTQFWQYPTSNPKKPNWATVERFEDTYCLGMSCNLPQKKLPVK